jgi:hypothetical protein
MKDVVLTGKHQQNTELLLCDAGPTSQLPNSQKPSVPLALGTLTAQRPVNCPAPPAVNPLTPNPHVTVPGACNSTLESPKTKQCNEMAKASALISAAADDALAKSQRAASAAKELHDAADARAFIEVSASALEGGSMPPSDLARVVRDTATALTDAAQSLAASIQAAANAATSLQASASALYQILLLQNQRKL